MKILLLLTILISIVNCSSIDIGIITTIGYASIVNYILLGVSILIYIVAFGYKKLNLTGRFKQITHGWLILTLYTPIFAQILFSVFLANYNRYVIIIVMLLTPVNFLAFMIALLIMGLIQRKQRKDSSEYERLNESI